MKDIFSLLPEGSFLRIHKKYAANIDYIDRLSYFGKGQYLIYLTDKDGTTLPVGRSYLEGIKKIKE